MGSKLLGFIIGTVVLLLTSCGDHYTTDYNDYEKKQIEIGISRSIFTRVSFDSDTTSSWTIGDQIGIYAVAHKVGEEGILQEQENFIHNIRLEYNGTTWIMPEIYWPIGDSLVDFYAYYPYKPDATNPKRINYNLIPNSGTDANISNTGLLVANNLNRNKKDAVQLTFNHALSCIKVTIPSPIAGSGPTAETQIKLKNVYTSGNLDLSVTDNGSTSLFAIDTTISRIDIIMSRIEQPSDANYATNYSYRTLIPQQKIKRGDHLFTIEHENRMLLKDKPQLSDLQLLGGKIEVFHCQIPVSTMLHTAYVPAGVFIMGSPTSELKRNTNETQHQVTLTKGFRMSKYEISNIQYCEFLNSNHIGADGKWSNAALFPDKLLIEDRYQSSLWNPWGITWNNQLSKWVPLTGMADNPIIYVTWHGAMEYAHWLGGTIPTEAQWEYACRGGQQASLPFGIGNGRILSYEMANFNGRYKYDLDNGGTIDIGNLPGVYPYKPLPINNYQSQPNGYGIYNMHGNVSEWCRDKFITFTSAPVVDPVNTTTPTNTLGVSRGGTWGSWAEQCRSAARIQSYQGEATYVRGIRVIFPD
ncbi:MAG: SUMF1/EgtB/PvdO family nonheme iron enzyme [Marinifilaceae bacterium]